MQKLAWTAIAVVAVTLIACRIVKQSPSIPSVEPYQTDPVPTKTSQRLAPPVLMRALFDGTKAPSLTSKMIANAGKTFSPSWNSRSSGKAISVSAKDSSQADSSETSCAQ